MFELSVGIAASVQKDKLPGVVELAWDTSSDDTRAYLQQRFDCCGYHNSTDRSVSDKCPVEKFTNPTIEGTCEHVLLKFLGGIVGKISAAAIVICIFEAATMVFTFVLARRIKDGSSETSGYTSVSTFGDEGEEDEDNVNIDGGDVIGDVNFGNDSLDDDGEIDFFALAKN